MIKNITKTILIILNYNTPQKHNDSHLLILPHLRLLILAHLLLLRLAQYEKLILPLKQLTSQYKICQHQENDL